MLPTMCKCEPRRKRARQGHGLKTVHRTVFLTAFRSRFAPPHQLHRDGTTVIDSSSKLRNKKKKQVTCPALLFGSPSWTRTNDIVINSHALYRLSYWGIFNLFPVFNPECFCLKSKSQHLPIFPGRLHPSIFGTTQFNFCVRHGNRWNLSAIGTGLSMALSHCF